MEQRPLTEPANGRTDLTRGLGRVVLTEAEIRGRIGELSQEISRDYAGLNPLLVGVLKGVIFFMSDLLLGITIPVTVDFMAISRYDPGRKTKGTVRLIKDLDDASRRSPSDFRRRYRGHRPDAELSLAHPESARAGDP